MLRPSEFATPRARCAHRFAALVAFAASVVGAATSTLLSAATPLPWGDQGDGTYANPVLFADYSDPDVIRVGGDFYLVSSDFHFVGIQVLHSTDLVNWQVIGQVFHRLGMAARYDTMSAYAEGTWAPSLRFHDGTFYLYACTPHDGLFCWTAKNPAGPWSDAVTVKAVDKWEDPCPIWDDDGQAYLVHRVHRAGPLILHKMSADGTHLLDDGVEIYRGPVAEGPKFFKRRGYYYISLPEGGVETGGQTILRSRDIYGPYERREVVPSGGPHQGGLVELDDGSAWFLGFKSAGAFGRVVHLLPVTWGDDDWPVFGDRGQPVMRWTKPALPASPISHPATSDSFRAPTLSPQWQWNHNPLDSAWSLHARPGWLRLTGQPADDLLHARNTLTQKIRGPAGTATVKLDAAALTPGQHAGLAFMSGKIFDSLELRASADHHLVLHAGAAPAISLPAPLVYLRAIYDGDRGHFQFSLDGVSFTDVGPPVTLKFGQWKGARLALFCYGDGGGHADFADFQYEVRPLGQP